jgi:predicted transcriptional regulator
MASVSLSTSVGKSLAAQLEIIAKREDRSTSRMIANAIAHYAQMPTELRETLRLLAVEDETFLRDVLNEMTAHAIERKFDFARRELARSTQAVPELEDASEAEIADAAFAIMATS